MDFIKSNYVNKEILLYPGTDTKCGIIKDVDDLGWTIEITESNCKAFKVGETYFISHTSGFNFSFIKRKVIYVSIIEWDTDGEDVDLPDREFIEVTPKTEYLLEDIDGEAENIANYLSDKYGWCIKNFMVEVG